MPTIRENLLTLRAVIEAAPTELFDLGFTVQKVDCGTSFCVFGWAAACEQFPGLTWEPHADSDDEFGQVKFNGKVVWYDRGVNNLDVLFGERSHANLFQYAGDGALDRELGFFVYPEDVYTNAEQKTLALARIDKQLESYP